MKSDIEIANSVDLKHISEIAKKLKLDEKSLEFYGNYKAKIPLSEINDNNVDKNNLILVTAISPTPAGEGKTTTSIGLTEGMNRIGAETTVVLREPSLGPVFGIKGGAAGGGYSQVLPMEDINLHFTGDFSAIEKAHNLLSAAIDNNIRTKSQNLNIDPRTVTWKRVMDMNDRALRNVIVGLGGKSGGVPRETGFDITAASEIMAILCLANDMEDLKERMGNIYVGDTYDGEPIYARDLEVQGAMAILMKDAIKPNLVQTMEGNPALIHGGPFANIAQGTNSVIATKMGLSHSDYVITEAGFGSDLGAEKFLDIKCQSAGLRPSAVVLVATARALKYHGGVPVKEVKEENVEALKKGLENLEKHIENIQSYKLPVIVAINSFEADSDAEHQAISEKCESLGVQAVKSEGFAHGGKGTEKLAQTLVDLIDNSDSSNFTPVYDWDSGMEDKINAIATKIYGASAVEYSSRAKKDLKRIDRLGLNHLPVCIAKTQKSFSDDASLKGRPRDFEISIREIEIAAGAGFVVPIAGNMMRMPGLPSVPSANKMDIDSNGKITGLT